MSAKTRDEIRQFCVRCFADDRGGSWGDGVHAIAEGGSFCANCCGIGSAFPLPQWAVDSIREQASWIGKRYYPHDEDVEKAAEVRYLRSIAPPPESTAVHLESGGWNVTQGRVSTIIDAPSEARAKEIGREILPYPVPRTTEERPA